nr:hypothetical protein [Tanacetum cinerariifolium]
MTSFGYRSNPRYTIKECSSCGTLYTRDCVCSKGNVEDKILVPKPPKNYAGVQDFQNTYASSNASTNVFNAPRDPYVVKQDHGSFVDKIIFDLNRAPDSPNQFHCFHCKDVIRDGEALFLKPLHKVLRISTIVAMSVDAHIGYNCPSKVPVIPNSEPCNNQTIDELPQALPMFHLTFHSEAESPFTLDSTPTYVDESSNVFNPPPPPHVYSCEFCGNDAYYGHYCTPQAPFIYPEPTLAKIKDQMTSFTSLCELACQVAQKKLEAKPIKEERVAKAKYWKLPVCYDDDNDEERPDSLDDNIISGLPPFPVITPDEPVLSTEEPDNSLRMGDEHLDTILATESNEFIKSGVKDLISIPSESEGILEHVCDVPSHYNSPPLDVIKDQIEDFSESIKEFSSIDDDSFSFDNIDYVKASPPNSELVSSKVMEIVIPEVGGIDDDILLTINHDDLHEKLLNVNLLISKIEALNANPTPSSDCKTKSSSTSLNSLLEETNTFDNSLPEFETFCFDVEEISSGSTTTHLDICLLEYEAFHDDHVKEISSGSPTTHSNSPLYASFMFELSINSFPPADRSDSYEFTDELIPFISA